MTLSNLCKYYISCIALESNTTLRASMKDEKSFIGLHWIDDNVLKSPTIGAFLRGNLEKEKELLIGYPVLKTRHFISPLFIIHVSYCDGTHGKREGFSIDKELLINDDKKVVNPIHKKYESSEIYVHIPQSKNFPNLSELKSNVPGT